MIHSVRYSKNRDRDEVLKSLRASKSSDPNYTVIDVGGSHTMWAKEFNPVVVDINAPGGSVKYFQGNINMPTVWNDILAYVEEHGKFNFCVCTHTLEDIANPRLAIEMMPRIADSGYIAVPSKYVELARDPGGPIRPCFRGSIHHRWIYNYEDETIVAYPKVNLIEKLDILDEVAAKLTNDNYELQFHWEGDLLINFINDDYLGPSDTAVMGYYQNLLRD